MDDLKGVTLTAPGEKFTPEQARNWVLDLASSVKEMRTRVDMEKRPVEQAKLYRKLLLRYGSAKGALDALYRVGHVDETFHRTVSDHLLVALAERTTGG